MSREYFIVCPIGDDGDDIRQRADDVTDYIIEPVLSGYGITISRADRLGYPGNITSQIIDKVIKADLVIADLTENNPNVYYELAIRHATRKPYIQMAQIGQRIPFDVTTQRTIFYDLNIRFVQRAKGELSAQVQTILESDCRVESPITAAIDLSALGSEDPLGRTLTHEYYPFRTATNNHFREEALHNNPSTQRSLGFSSRWEGGENTSHCGCF